MQAQLFGRVFGVKAQVYWIRWMMNITSLVTLAPRGVAKYDVVVEGVRVRVYRDRKLQSGRLPLVVYIHGGGFVFGCVGMCDGDRAIH